MNAKPETTTRRKKSSSAVMAQGAVGADRPLQFEHPMLFDGVPHLGGPKDVRTVRVELHVELRITDVLVRGLVIIKPVFDLLTLEQVSGVGDCAVLIFLRQPDVA